MAILQREFLPYLLERAGADVAEANIVCRADMSRSCVTNPASIRQKSRLNSPYIGSIALR